MISKVVFLNCENNVTTTEINCRKKKFKIESDYLVLYNLFIETFR